MTAAQRERPIIFGAESVRAILDGRKTQTRRICAKAMGTDGQAAASVHPDGAGTGWIAWWPHPVSADETKRLYPGSDGFQCPHGEPGDRLWVRETWGTVHGNGIRTVYRADGPPRQLIGGEVIEGMKWTSPIYMPRWASRIDLEVLSVRIQRLQDISEEDAKADGVDGHVGGEGPVSREALQAEPGFWHPRFYRDGFEWAWSKLHDKPAEFGASWASNPWVWVIEFRRVRP